MEVKKRSTASSEVAQKLDNSFPTKLLAKSGVDLLSIEDLNARLEGLKEKRSNLL